jgi:hypothetical protein
MIVMESGRLFIRHQSADAVVRRWRSLSLEIQPGPIRLSSTMASTEYAIKCRESIPRAVQSFTQFVNSLIVF